MFPRSICSFLNWEKNTFLEQPKLKPKWQPKPFWSWLLQSLPFWCLFFRCCILSWAQLSCFKTLGFATRHLWPRANACFSYCPVANTQYPTYFAKVRLLVFVLSAFETPKVQWNQTCPFICYLCGIHLGPPLGRPKHPYEYIEFLFVIFESFIYVYDYCALWGASSKM